MLFWLTTFVACPPAADTAKDPDTSESIDTSADSGLDSAPPDSAADTADSAPEPTVFFSELSITPSPDMPTVLTVTWSTDVPTAGSLEYGESTAYGQATPVESAESTEHSVVVRGLAAATEWHFRPTGGGEHGSDTAYTTGPVPSGYPSFTVAGDPAAMDGFVVAPVNGALYAVVILDSKGRYTWWHEVEGDYLVTRAMLTRDGTSVVYGAVGTEDYGPDGRLVIVTLDGSTETTLDVPYLTHDFEELPDGSFACLTKDLQSNYVGDRIVEVQRNGDRSVVWSVFDHFNPANYEIDETDGTWTHANALDYDEADDAWYISLRNLDTILKADRQSDAIQWRLTGDNGNFTYEDGAEPTEYQHEFELLSNGNLIVFDNGSTERGASRVVEYDLNEALAEVRETFSYTYDPPLYTYALGDVDRVDDDRVLVTWSTSGLVQLVTNEGTELWSLSSDLGYVFGYTQRVERF
ncbi:MAG: aryl-sulfate sulfotransferase [Deltaproteobacteria bacterium]|nr:aryl-sulfate sulfotransferase [Deltaproteobacteria bacterium]